MHLNPNVKKWVISADCDQAEEGKYNEGNSTLTSTLKRTGKAIQDIADRASKGDFPRGEVLNYGLSQDGVGLTGGQLSKEIINKIEGFKQQIMDGEIESAEKSGK